MLDSFKDIFENKNVEFAIPNSRAGTNYDKVDKELVKHKLETKERMVKLQKDLQNLNSKQRREYMLTLKSEADNIFHAKNFKDAIEKYLDIVLSTSYVGMTEAEKVEYNEFFLQKIICSMIVCTYEMGEFQRGILLLSKAEALKITPRTKYLRAIILLKQEKLYEAKTFISEALVLNHSIEGSARERFLEVQQQIDNEIKAFETKQKQMFAGIFKPAPKNNSAKVNHLPVEKRNMIATFCNYLTAKLRLFYDFQRSKNS